MKYSLLKKADILLILVFLIGGLTLYSLNVFSHITGETVKITVNGTLYGTYPLNMDKDITISQNGHVNIVSIKNKKIVMSYSDCKGHDCQKCGKITEAGVPIICAPNGIVAVIEGKGADTAAY